MCNYIDGLSVRTRVCACVVGGGGICVIIQTVCLCVRACVRVLWGGGGGGICVIALKSLLWLPVLVSTTPPAVISSRRPVAVCFCAAPLRGGLYST